MSHFTVIICLEDQDSQLARITRAAREGFPLRDLITAHLDHILAPFDENRETEPYRDYESGSPEDHWLCRSVRRGAESWQQLQDKGAEALATERITAHGPMPVTPEEAAEMVLGHAREWEADSADAARLGEHPSWADIARLYNARYGDEGDTLLVDDSSRAYTMSTRNPQAKWDWWTIGGRWGGHFPYRPEHAGEVIAPERQWSSPDIMPLHCDGGPVRALDLDALREKNAAEARKDYAEYQAAVAGTPEALPWSVFTENISPGNGYTIDRAREEYNSQPRVRALEGTRFSRPFGDDPIAEFSVPEAVYAERRRARAVPGYATLTADGRWMAPGKMGWFGMSTDGENERIGYWEAANAYIAALPDNAWLVLADCHI